MKKSLKYFVACFLGAGIGTLTALEINGYFWWLGLLVGGFVGYIFYEFKLVLKACKNAWEAVVSIRITKEQWRSFFRWWVGVATAITGSISLTTSYVIGVVILLPMSEKSVFLSVVCGTSIILGGIIVFGITCGLLIATMLGEKSQKEDCIDSARYLIYHNPLRICFLTIPRFFFQSMKWMYINTPKYLPKVIAVAWPTLTIVAVTVFRFVKHVFIEIHSDERLLVGIDSAIGATIGYFAGSVIIGAISGGLFGLLNYEILSKRVLRVVPSKTNNA